MNESFVDLSYRGLSLGRRIKLTQVRPSSGYVELPSPMPVGTQIALVTDDGIAFDAAVAWIHEQVAGADRPPGMVVIPELGSDAAAAWWKARVALPEDDTPRPRPRSRPVTVRPRTHTKPTPPTTPVVDMSAIKADLEARVTAAARVEPPPAPAVTEPVGEPDDPAMGPPRTAGISSEHAVQRPDEDDEPEMTVSTDEDSMPEAPPPLRRTGEHAVVDDGKPTVIMQSVDPEALGLDFPAGEVTDPGRPPRAGSPIPGESSESMDDGPTDPGNGAGRDRR